jgi:hypothetical protein
VLPVDGIVKFNGPLSMCPGNKSLWIIQWQISQLLLYYYSRYELEALSYTVKPAYDRTARDWIVFCCSQVRFNTATGR